MESRSRRRLGWRPPRGARRRRDPGADGDGVDRISGLHDDLLLLVLARLRSAGDAARSSVLSSRWSDLWRRLPELYFLDRISPSALKAALAMIAVPKLSVLHIADPDCSFYDAYSAADIASLLHTAACLDPLELSIIILRVDAKDGNIIELPCFAHATSITLDVRGRINLTLPAQGGEFPELERLSIGFCRIDTGALISRCPYLRVLELNQCRNDGPLKVHSTTIEELVVTDDSHNPRIRSIDIVAPVLKKFRLSTRKHKDFTMSLLATVLENLTWNFSVGYPYSDLKIDEMWFVGHQLESKKEESGCIVLRLDIRIPKYPPSYEQKLQEIFQFPKFSVLVLNIETCGHVYGPMVLNLLRIHNGVRRLKLATNQLGLRGEECTLDCPCDQPQNWSSQNILMDLEEVEMENYKVSGHEIDFMKLLFRCSPLTKVVVKLASYVSIRSKRFKEICNLFKANPSVECHVYHKCGKEVMCE
ncbi:hypothetical protein EJB05_11202, partial [Eragrostis curvula]